MSQVTRKSYLGLLERISVLYGLGIIDSTTRDELVEMTKDAKSDSSALYLRCISLPNHPLVEEMKEIIIFQ